MVDSLSPGYRAAVLKFHALGDWPPDAVHVAWTSSTRAVVAEAEAAIERAWEAALARPGVRLFDGPMCRLESFHATANTLHLNLSRTSYKAFLGTNMADPTLADRFGAGVLANPVGVSVALTSTDGRLLMGRRNARVAYYPNRLHPFAGALEPGDDGQSAGTPDVFACARRELAEELRLEADEVDDLRCVGLAEDAALRQPEVILLGQARKSLTQLEQSLDGAEHRMIEPIAGTAEALERFLHAADRTPVAAAAGLLWGRRRLGAAWFDRAARTLGVQSNVGGNL